MAENLVCWKCGASIGHLPLPLGRMSKCDKCKTDLHVCKLCNFYDTTRANQCREPVADPVSDKQRSNFCGYFQVKPDVFKSSDSTAATVAQQELGAIFGEPVDIPDSDDPDKSKAELEKLFGASPDSREKGE